MFSTYKCTPVEQWINALYAQHDILSTDHLNIETLALRMNTWVYYKPISSRCIDRGGGMYSVVIDSRLDKKSQWEDFLHELCHILRHTGNQHELPPLLVDWQEDHADAFMLYASIPIYMVRQMDLPEHRQEIIDFLATEFTVTHQLAERRLGQIERRILQGTIDDELLKQSQPKKLHKPYSAETQRILQQLQRQIQA